jgi:hypothetical protein
MKVYLKKIEFSLGYTMKVYLKKIEFGQINVRHQITDSRTLKNVRQNPYQTIKNNALHLGISYYKIKDKEKSERR